jgi:uncharacterized membrane protein YbhN (UPF0104 family)
VPNGGIDTGLIGMLLVLGAPAAATVAAVVVYRVILFWLPLIGGAIAVASLRRTPGDIKTRHSYAGATT